MFNEYRKSAAGNGVMKGEFNEKDNIDSVKSYHGHCISGL